jgi:hypothetical protein
MRVATREFGPIPARFVEFARFAPEAPGSAARPAAGLDALSHPM